uniref:Protein asunder n=1 Tax=Panagrolaimus sp. JU765 TaxID=591449 RepID=A0AC34QGN6_9BILA
MERLTVVNNKAHKAVFILDRGPTFARYAEVVSLYGTKVQRVGLAPKTLWNCSIDAAIEFQRIVTDIFPSGTHQTRFIISEATSQKLFQNWHRVALNQEEFIQALFEQGCADVNPELDPSVCSITNAIPMALGCFNEWSPLQRRAHECQKKTIEHAIKKKDFYVAVEHTRELDPFPDTLHDTYKLDNNCSLFIITSFNRIDAEFDALCDNIMFNMNAKNRIIDEQNDNSELPIDNLQVYILNVANSFNGNSPVRRTMDGGKLKFCMYTVTGRKLNPYLRRIMMEAYDLTSTTISGIPMKEESSPYNTSEYDVEILHPRALHKHLDTANLLGDSSPIIKRTQEGGYNTVSLRWCNPVQKLRKDAYPIREEGYYATPADASGRPTICFTSFLKKGKSIWLEATVNSKLPENIPGKIITHTVINDVARSGMIIQSLAIGQKLKAHGLQFENVLTKEESTIIEGLDEPEISENYLKELSETMELIVEPRQEQILFDQLDPYLAEYPNERPDISEKIVEHDNIHNMEYLYKAKKDAKRDFIGFSNTLYWDCDKYQNLRDAIKSNDENLISLIKAEVREIIKDFSDRLKNFSEKSSKGDKIMMNRLLIILTDCLVHLAMHKPDLQKLYLMSVCQLVHRYVETIKIKVLAYVMPYEPPELERKLVPLCFRPGYKVELYKGQVFEDDPVKATQTTKPEEKKRKKHDDSSSDEDVDMGELPEDVSTEQEEVKKAEE